MNTISLNLAREIAKKYEQLGMAVPDGEMMIANGTNHLGWLRHITQFTTTELFSALPVGIAVVKEQNFSVVGYCVWHDDDPIFVPLHHEILVEALGMMLCRVLDEQIKQKGV